MSAFFQGSYGVVKLAYNEDDNTYYVSPSSTIRVLVPAPLAQLKGNLSVRTRT